jgi:flavin-dependent trigonelline monooxygenase, oxygenase component
MHLALDLPAHWPNTGHHIDHLFPELLEVVKLADEIGFDSFALAEHHFNDYFVQPAPLTLAAHIAAITPRQRFIVAVMVLPYHQVQRLAGEIAMTDQLTGGRLEVGFGRGGAKFEADRFGISHQNSREIFDDRLRALLILFSGKDVSYDGLHAKFPPLTIMPPPRQKPHPPFWIAAINPEAIFHCARNGFNVQAAALRRDMAAVREMVKAFRQGVSEARSRTNPGRQKISIHQTVYVAKNDADVEEKMKMIYRNHQLFENHYKNSGEIIGGITQPVEIKETIDDLKKGVIVGKPEYCVDRLLELKELGFDQLIMRTHFGPPVDEVKGSLRRFAEHVMPQLTVSSNSR